MSKTKQRIGYISPVLGGWEFSDAEGDDFRAFARTKNGALQQGADAGFTHYRDLGRDFSPGYQWGSRAPVRKITSRPSAA